MPDNTLILTVGLPRSGKTTRKRRDYWRDERWAMTEEDNRMIAVIERMHEQFEMPEVLEEVLP